MPWEPVVTTGPAEDVRVIINGVDVSFQRGVVAVIEGWGSGEPFSDTTASITFPQITTFEAIPSWLPDAADIDIILVREGTRKTLWEGMYISEDDDISASDAGLRIECIGALYQVDFYQRPEVAPSEATYLRGSGVPGVPFSHRIIDEFTETRTVLKMRSSLRLAYPMVKGSSAPENNLVAETGVAGEGVGIFVDPNQSWEPALTGRSQSYLALAVDSLGQWTLTKDVGRRPVIRRKDRTTRHWTVHVGAPGVSQSLHRDITMAPNTIYGEGIDPGQCKWRNTRYPRLMGPPEANFVANMSQGNNSPAWRTFERALIEVGWGLNDDGVYNPWEVKQVKRLQRVAGLAETGVVDVATWNVVFDNSLIREGVSSRPSYFAPLAIDRRVEPYLYNATGHVIGDNPLFAPMVPRVERFENFGAGVTREEAFTAAEAELARDSVAGYYGTLTLQSDPEEGSLLEISAGQNILLRGHRGVDRLMHIAQVRIDKLGRSANLTVDEKARDLPLLSALITREREMTDPTRRKQRTYRNSKAVEDRHPIWDCESGAGVFPRTRVNAATWFVRTVPAGTGSIVRSDFRVDTPARFAVGVFDRVIDPLHLQRLGSPLDGRYWDDLGEDRGLVIAFGGENQAGGYYPGTEMGENPDTGAFDPLTGRMVDNASWYVENYLGAPLLWVAVWVESPATNFIQGRFAPAAA